MNGGVASVERSSKKWTCASPQAQADNNYTTPPTGEQERLERLEKKAGWFDPPKKPRRPQARSDQSREEMLNQVAKKLNFNEESSPSLSSSSSSMSPNTLTSPFGHLKLSTQHYQLGHSSQFTPTQQRTTGGITGTAPEAAFIASSSQQQQQQQPQQNVSIPQDQNQNRSDILPQQSQISQQLQVGLGSQQRQYTINRSSKPLQQSTNNNTTSNQHNNNNNNNISSNILKFR